MTKSKKFSRQSSLLFNTQLLESQLETFSFQDIPDFEKKRSIITNWNNSDLKTFTETGLDADFFVDFFSQILRYNRQISSSKIFHIAIKRKIPFGTDFPDASLGILSNNILNDENEFIKAVRVIVELKSPSITDLDKKQKSKKNLSHVDQAFNYAQKFEKCKWIIVSNYYETRLYNTATSTKYEIFFLKDLLNESIFKKFYYLLNKDNLIALKKDSVIDLLYKRNLENPKPISVEFYDNYKKIRILLINNIITNNKDFIEAKNISELEIIEKTQKILDRIIFIAFCRDHNLAPHDIFNKIYSSFFNLWESFKFTFNSFNEGYTNPSTKNYINKFNAGLFAEDEIIDHVRISEDILIIIKDEILSFNFNSQLNIDLLGYIFEQSISDIEEIKKYYIIGKHNKDINFGIEPINIDLFISTPAKSKDKKVRQTKKQIYQGIIYTPPHITKYITLKAIERWIDKQKKIISIELGKKIEFIEKTTDTNLKIEYYKKLLDKIRNIKILDPACGSGGFLLHAFDKLLQITEEFNSRIIELTSKINNKENKKQKLRTIQAFMEIIPKEILRNTLYGVDINYESVEITKLSLWLKTASKNKPLTFLDDNIKHGNSLIEEEIIGNHNYFDWKKEFENVFENGGFDIIIGNPPYDVMSEKETGLKNIPDQIKYFKQHPILKHAMYQKSNLYKLFIVKSSSLLKENGVMSFIVPMSLMADRESNTVRKYLFNNFLFNFFEVFPQKDDYKNRIFKNAKLSTCIFQIERNTEIDGKRHIFFVRIHPGKDISTELEQSNRISLADIKIYDKNYLSIPISTNSDWKIMKKIMKSRFLKTMQQLNITQFQGEVNETNINAKNENVILSENNGFKILRGSCISRYCVRNPSQGTQKWIDAPEFLKIMIKSKKAKHYLLNRIGFQRSAPQNNFRRLIAAPINKNNFCFDTVSYVTENSCSIDLNLMLVILNSEMLEWFFRNRSSNSKINEYQFNEFIIPIFEKERVKSEKIDNLENYEDYPGIILRIEREVENIRSNPKNHMYPLWIEEILCMSLKKIINYEQLRGMDLSKRNRAKLDDKSYVIQHFIDDILFLLYDITSTEKKYIRDQIK